MSESKRPTINEIARMARVSKGTVSKILNNKPGIGAETRKRVLDLVRHLDYTPNSSARALAVQRTNNIGLIVPFEAARSPDGSYWSSLITSVARQAAENQHDLILFTPQAEGKLDELYESILRFRKVDGLIIGAALLNKENFSHLLASRMPFTLLGQNKNFQHYSVDVDNREAAYRMTRYILGHGFNRPAYLAGPLELLYNQNRLDGYQDAMREAKLRPLFHSAEFYRSTSVRQALDRTLEEGPIDSLFVGAGGDFLFDVLGRLRERSIDPAGLGLVVFDDYRFLDFMDPKITALTQPLEKIGQEATRMLLSLIEGNLPEEGIKILEAGIHPRGSCRDQV